MVSGFNDNMEQNVVVYKDPENDDANLFVEQLGPSGMSYLIWDYKNDQILVLLE